MPPGPPPWRRKPVMLAATALVVMALVGAIAFVVLRKSDDSGAPVQNNTVVDPRVPANVGVRVVELTSARFPAGSAVVMPDHAAELNRVVNIMNALPNITMTVIGHADQRGTSDDNLKLSRLRAQAVVDYLVSQGINAERLASKAVGSDEPLTQDTSEAAYALNRRTEFVFYGLLVGT